MGLSEDVIIAWFAQYAYQPLTVYAAIFFVMFISSFGFPIPEEVTLVGAGLVCYMGSRPDLYPPPYPGAPVVHTYWAAMIAFGSVIFSDTLVFTLGRRFGGRLLRSRFMERYQVSMAKISRWTTDYGAWAAGIFRFTPGLRFPGHFACGMLGLTRLKFVAVDGIAALFSVPTQVVLVAWYGEHILKYFKQFKLVIFSILAIIFIVYVIRKVRGQRLSAKESSATLL